VCANPLQNELHRQTIARAEVRLKGASMMNTLASFRTSHPPNWCAFYLALRSIAPGLLAVEPDVAESIELLSEHNDLFWSDEIQGHIESSETVSEVPLDTVLSCWLEKVKVELQMNFEAFLDPKAVAAIHSMQFQPNVDDLKRELTEALCMPWRGDA
jgi:hypothetical protein